MTARPRKPRLPVDPTGKSPTPRQQQALDLITAGIRSGRPPTLREIGAAMGIASTNGVSCLLRALERKGWVEREPGELARCTYRPTARLPPLSDVWLFALAERLAQAIDGHYGRAELVSGLADPRPWWRLVVTTGGWSDNEAAEHFEQHLVHLRGEAGQGEEGSQGAKTSPVSRLQERMVGHPSRGLGLGLKP